MSFRSNLLGLGLAIAATATTANAAVLANSGFETGDLSGWSFTSGFVEAVTEADDAIVTPPFGQHYEPVEGDFFAKLTAGVDIGVYSVLSQSFTLTSTSTIKGSAAFLAFDYDPYDDDGYVRLIGGAGGITILFASSVLTVGDYGHTDWTSFSSGPLSAGIYTIEAGVRDNVDFGGSSQLLVDGLSVTAVSAPGVVPEPATWALMIGGFGLAGAMLRRRPAAA